MKMMLFEKMTPQNSAVLVIDVVNSCAHPNCEIKKWKITFNQIRQMVPRLQEFIALYKSKYGQPVIYTTTVPWQREYLADNINQLYEDPKSIYYTQDRSGFAEEFYELRPQADDFVVAKNTNDAFAMSQLREYAQKNGIQYFITTGIFTDGCVMASVVGGFSFGYNFVVLRDLVETTDVIERQNLQKLLLEDNFPYLWSRVISSEHFLREFTK